MLIKKLEVYTKYFQNKEINFTTTKKKKKKKRLKRSRKFTCSVSGVSSKIFINVSNSIVRSSSSLNEKSSETKRFDLLSAINIPREFKIQNSKRRRRSLKKSTKTENPNISPPSAQQIINTTQRR